MAAYFITLCGVFIYELVRLKSERHFREIIVLSVIFIAAVVLGVFYFSNPAQPGLYEKIMVALKIHY